jgi:putative mRNA 3-end processing factor
LLLYKRFKIGNLDATLFDAHHIPGSASIYLADSKKILFTGDINMHPTHLIDYKPINYPKIDCLITESTYSERDHPDRKVEERNFIKKVKEYSDGLVLIPTFAVGRAQELLLMLSKNNLDKNLYLDGMAQKASDIILYHKNSIRYPNLLKKILMKIKFVRTKKQRDKIVRNGGIVVTTSGMINGGPIVYYLKKARDRKDTCLLFTGFQVEGTPGEKLLRTKVFENEEEKFKVDIEIKKFDFSGHAGRNELFNLIKRINPKRVICIHGEQTRKFAREIEKELKIPAIAPRMDEKVEI